MPNVIHFEICVDDLGSAAAFYASVFDWDIEPVKEDSEYLSIGVREGVDRDISGGLTVRVDEQNSTINTIQVPSVDIYARKITENGGKILAPKISIPGQGYVQYCHDLEGNTFGIMELDKSAQ